MYNKAFPFEKGVEFIHGRMRWWPIYPLIYIKNLLYPSPEKARWLIWRYNQIRSEVVFLSPSSKRVFSLNFRRQIPE